MGKVDFSGRVVIVTGAGNGLGRTYALLFASRGASVVVNDLGGSMSGEGGSSRAADVVVDEIKAAGGTAVANYDSVEFGDRIVATAIDAFGRVDVVVNNAGILRDKSFHKMSHKDWDLVLLVHLKGAYSVTKAAWPYFREQGYGRVLFTTSGAGLYGNFGQANYTAAKMALVGLSNTLALEGEKRNIFVNTIAPLAGSRLTETVFPPDMIAALKPDYVAPLVVYLCSEENTTTHGLFELGGGWYSRVRWERSPGQVFGVPITADDIARNIDAITDFTGADHPDSSNSAFGPMMENLANVAGDPAMTSSAASSGIRFDGKVVIVTGAGNGLGRTYAHLFGALGASVVVNDLGGSATGEGGSSRAADVVVDEIKAAGGTAVANYDSVEFGDRIVATAIDAFGRVDVVINNAGILRDKSFHKMTDRDWDLVYTVHLKGAYSVTKAAWPYFREQRSGRVVFTTSAAGIYGNFGQSNYSAAKMGLIGLAQTLAKEGEKRNIFCNVIAPIAGSRLTATVLPQTMLDALKPEFVAPMVAFLSSDACGENGNIFELGAGWYSRLRLQRSQGTGWVEPTPELVRDNFGAVCDFESGECEYPGSASDAFTEILRLVGLRNAGGSSAASTSAASPQGNEHVQPDQVVGFKPPALSYSYTDHEVILYALGVGAAVDPLDDSELRFVYENHSDFGPLPTFGVIPAFPALGQIMATPGLSFNPMMLLHGEQDLTIHAPVPIEATLTTQAEVTGLYDKGNKGAVVEVTSTTVDEHGNQIFTNKSTLFIRGIGNFGGDRGGQAPDYSPPARGADVVHTDTTEKNQALLYRLSGDSNPLHADPSMAAMGGFDRPILHGLCSMGYAGRAITKHFAGGDPSRVKRIAVRFAKPVFPGESIETSMWEVAPGVVHFTVRVPERDAVVIKNAVAEIEGAPLRSRL